MSDHQRWANNKLFLFVKEHKLQAGARISAIARRGRASEERVYATYLGPEGFRDEKTQVLFQSLSIWSAIARSQSPGITSSTLAVVCDEETSETEEVEEDRPAVRRCFRLVDFVKKNNLKPDDRISI